MLLTKSSKGVFLVIFSVIAAVGIVYLVNYFLFDYNMAIKKVSFITSDNKKIVANLFPVDKPSGWLLLVHMMPDTKESWNDFALKMQSIGYESLAIDLRGHGDSTTQINADKTRTDAEIKLDYRNFSDAEHQASIKDLEASWEFLKSRGATPEKTAVIGASIGANLSLQFLTLYPDISAGVLLSPGNYRGIDSGLLVKNLNPNQKILLAASKLDNGTDGNNAEQNQEYYNLASQVKNRHLILFDNAGHGTNLLKLKEEYDLTEAIIKFLKYGKIN